MPTAPARKKPTSQDKLRVVKAVERGDPDWLLVARHNELSQATAYRVKKTGRTEHLPRGGARAACTKVTPAILASLEDYLHESCDYTLKEMGDMVVFDHDVLLSESTISRQLINMLYSMKQTRIEPQTCNNEVNLAKRKAFAEELLRHAAAGDCIVYMDETNYSLYCRRSYGRSRVGERVTVVLPPSKGPNLQVQCAVSSTIGLVHSRLQRGSIHMEVNAAFVEEVYQATKASDLFQQYYQGKKVVIVLDNAPCHSQTEKRIPTHDDMATFRLGPYSPMCNPIEGCFSVVKARIKRFLCLNRDEMLMARGEGIGQAARLTLTERRMQLLERAAADGLMAITPVVVTAMELHARSSVIAATRMEPTVYGQ